MTAPSTAPFATTARVDAVRDGIRAFAPERRAGPGIECERGARWNVGGVFIDPDDERIRTLARSPRFDGASLQFGRVLYG